MILEALHLTLFELLRGLGTAAFIALLLYLIAHADPEVEPETSESRPELERHQGKTRIGIDHPLRVIGGSRKDR